MPTSPPTACPPPGSRPALGPHQRVTGKATVCNRSALFSLSQPQVANACNLGTGCLLELKYRCGNALEATTLGAGIPTGAVVHKAKVYGGISGSDGTPPPPRAGPARTMRWWGPPQQGL